MHTFTAHESANVHVVAFAADGRTLLTGGYNEVGLWNVPEGTRAADFHAVPIPGLASILWLDGEFEAPSEGPSSALVVCWATDSHHYAVPATHFVEYPGGMFAYSADDGLSDDEDVPDEDEPDGDRPGLHRLSTDAEASGHCGWGGTRVSNDGRKFPIGALAIHPTTGQLAMTCGVQSETAEGFESGIEFFDVETGESQRLLRVAFRFDHISRIQFTPDGEYLIGVSGPLWRAWRVETGEEVGTAKPTRKHILDLALTADGERFATVGNDKLVHVWSVADWSECGGFEWDIGPLTCVAASPDGCLLAAGSKKGRVVVWDDVPS